MATIMKLSTYTTLKKNPALSGLYKRYDDITISHCANLIEILYDNDIFLWTNPLTKKKYTRLVILVLVSYQNVIMYGVIK